MVTAYGLLIAERALHDANATRIREIDYRRAGIGAPRRLSSPWLSARVSGWASSAIIILFQGYHKRTDSAKPHMP
jgi:hypothetical protein